jgi:hypothetical protein
MTVPVYVFACDKYYWALRVMLYLYEQYWNWPVTVFGFGKPDFELPYCATFQSMGAFADYPADKWSDAVIGVLKSSNDEYAVILLEDYWLTRQVNTRAIRTLRTYMSQHHKIARADLVTDRLYAENMKDVEPFDELDIITNDPPAPYHLSTQASVWNLLSLREVLRPGESAGNTEIGGSGRLAEAGWQVIGTRQSPVRYIIGVQNGKLALDGGYQKPGPVWKPMDLEAVTRMLKEAGKL